DQPRLLEPSHRLTQGVAVGSVLLGQLALAGQPFTSGELSTEDPLLQLLEDRVRDVRRVRRFFAAGGLFGGSCRRHGNSLELLRPAWNWFLPAERRRDLSKQLLRSERHLRSSPERPLRHPSEVAVIER